MKRRNNPFRKTRKSPYDELGPNAKALRRSLEWLATHGPDDPPPLSVEIPGPGGEVRKPEEESKQEGAAPTVETELQLEPAGNQSAQSETTETQVELTEPQNPGPQDTETNAEPQSAQPETPKPHTIELELDPPDTDAPESGAADLSGSEDTMITDAEEDRIAAAAAGGAPANPRDDLLDARRFPKHYPPAAEPDRHERLCSICHHDDRDAIEEAFLQWRRPGDIRLEFSLTNRTALYRHAHALGLFEQRGRAVRHVLEKIMEESTTSPPTADSMIRAVRAYSCLDERGRWVEPPRRLIISREPFTVAPSLPPGREITVEPGKENER